MFKLEFGEFPSRYLDCYESALIGILKYMGLPEETPLMGTQAYFVLWEPYFSITPRFFNDVTEEWKRIHGLTVDLLAVAGESDLRQKIVSKLDSGAPVCLPVDIYFLPHTSHFNRLHQHHFIDIFGYDDDRYYIVCPYYRFVGWLGLDLIHTSFFSPTIQDKHFWFISELKLQELSPEKVCSLVKESCQNMLGLAAPEALADMDPKFLGLSGIHTFSDLLQKLAAKRDGILSHTLFELSTEIMAIGYSRYWFHRLFQTCQPYLLSADTAANLQGQFASVVDSWRVAGLRFGAGIHARRYEMIEQAALRLERVCEQEAQLFNSLWRALNPNVPDVLADRFLPGLTTDQQAPSESVDALVAPRTFTEEVLIKVWAEVMGLDQVSVYDNFFALGGDSITSIEIAARASQMGVGLTPQQVFEYQTIAELAVVADALLNIQAKQGRVTGLVPLTPIQHLFFERDLTDLGSGQAVLLELQQTFDPAVLERVIQHLLLRHDALRLRFVQGTSGWQQTIAGTKEPVPFSHLDLAALPETEQREAIEKAAVELQTNLNLEGPLLRVAFFGLGVEKPSYLLMVIHRLAVDEATWRILLSDLWMAYQKSRQGEQIQLPPQKLLFRQWAERLTEYAQSDEVKQELDFWLAEPRRQTVSLLVDHPDGANTRASAQTVTVSLGVQETQALIHAVQVYHTQTGLVLLTALAQVFAVWTGSRLLPLDWVEHRGTGVLEELDFSHTAGWLTWIFPLLLDLDKAQEPGDALKSVKEQLYRVPHRGIGYGLLYYLGDRQIAEKLAALARPQISFNYMGHLDPGCPEAFVFTPIPESGRPIHRLEENRPYLFEINGSITEGRLRVDWLYSRNIHRWATIEHIAHQFLEALRALITHCQSPEVEGYTPSDFPLARLDEQKLDKLSALINQIDR